MQTEFAEIEDDLSAIVERQEGVAAALTRLDAYLREKRAALPERLVHFLEKRSYSKALAFVREGDTGHHP